jgi:transposase
MSTRRHRRYSTEFKIQLVQEYLDGETSVRAVARRHGVGPSLLTLWMEKYQRGELGEEVQLGEQVQEYETKIEALERKIGQLTMELDVVKKTLSHRVAETDAPSSIISGPGVFPSRKDVGS